MLQRLILVGYLFSSLIHMTGAFITSKPTYQRTRVPTYSPSIKPTTFTPTVIPTNTDDPTEAPTFGPTLPTSQPTSEPSLQPHLRPSSRPSAQPSVQPTNPTSQPSSAPTSQPSRQPSEQPSGQPTGQPSRSPTSQPSRQPTGQPSRQPSRQPTFQPSSHPTVRFTTIAPSMPTSQPSRQPTRQPTGQPSLQPSRQPTGQPSLQPVSIPSRQPSSQPTRQPTSQPSLQPSRQPTGQPSLQPSRQPTGQPSRQPTGQPTGQPSLQPASRPSRQPTGQPSGQPSRQPSGQPSRQPTCQPTGQPSRQPSTQPSRQPIVRPSAQPSGQPTRQPSKQPVGQPTSQPTNPTSQPSRQPSSQPSRQPIMRPSGQPTTQPTNPTGQPSRQPSRQPTCQPTTQPTNPTSRPTCQPSRQPTRQPTSRPTRPTSQPSRQPSGQPSGQPSRQPTRQPTSQPTNPTSQPSRQPSGQPSGQPTRQPSGQPTRQPTSQPSAQPSYHPTSRAMNTRRPTAPTYKPTTFPSMAPTYFKNSTKYESISREAFNVFTPLWTKTHDTWTKIDPNLTPCDAETAVPSYPVCIDGYLIPEASFSYKNHSQVKCPDVQCIKKVPGVFNCSATPSDTADYLPPASNTTLDSNLICPLADFAHVDSTFYGLDEGIPPFFLPVTPVRLNIRGVVTAQVQDQCVQVADAEIVAWQINPTALEEYTMQSQKEHVLNYTRDGRAIPTHDANPTTMVSSRSYTSLRELTCRGMQHSGDNGEYEFSTMMPPSYGPPRHIMFTITAPGYHNLTTRMYFDKDHRLQQLTTLHGEEDSRVLDSTTSGYTSLKTGHNNTSGHTLFDKESVFPGRIAEDPRVARVVFHTNTYNSYTQTSTGEWRTEFNFVLSPLRPHSDDFISTSTTSDKTAAVVLPTDIDGLWSEPNGGLVRVTTAGTSFLATQYSHARSWGSIVGSIWGDSIRGVDFHQVIKRDEKIVSHPQSQGESYAPSTTLWSTGTTTGVVLPSDPFSTAAFSSTQPSAVSIQWSGGGYDMLWSKYSGTERAGHRYLKLLVSRETGGYDGKLVINEIEFYEGILTQTQKPSAWLKMKTARTPAPQMVSCSSFEDQSSHCYKAFDGDASASSAWVTKAVGHKDFVLSPSQWITFDFGKGHTVQPTGMRIVCDASNPSHPKGCPKTFTLLGSHDNIKFDLLYKQDFYDYNNEYADGGGMFYFIYEHSAGRMNSQRCGSCENGPNFQCHIQAYDGTCNSRYCNINGFCDAIPECPPGEYMDFIFTSYSTPSFQCKQCAPGRYGDKSGLISSYCSGLCAAGYYCPSGSTSPTQYECGNVHVICPEGTGFPIPAAAGRYTKSISSSDVSDSDKTKTKQSYDILCELGHYCKGGESFPCPVGTYGDRLGLQTSQCSGDCEAGSYCPLGSVVPTVCEIGYYCSDGRTRTICAAGTFGATVGLRDRTCSGLCLPGHYCSAGSVSATSAICPAGRYGSVAGLTNSLCSGVCTAGYYCPEGSVSTSMYECGGNNYYCPKGSSYPVTVTRGYFSTGGTPNTRTSEAIAEIGYYTSYGVRKSCPAGTFGSASGLDFDFFQNTSRPSVKPSLSPSQYPLRAPTFRPTLWFNPTSQPSSRPSQFLSRKPSMPTSQPSRQPTGQPSGQPSRQPSGQPTRQPTSQPSRQPSSQPTRQPTGQPSRQPTRQPSSSPSLKHTGVPTPFHTSVPTYEYDTFQPTSTPSFADWTTEPTMTPVSIEDTPAATILCSGYCARGYYCPLNSTSMTQVSCPAGRYGATVGLKDARCTAICPLGHYCPSASVTPIRCPGGVYGNTTGLVDASCSTSCWIGGCKPNLCHAGYYCPVGSITGTQYTCGGVDKFCPMGSSSPSHVRIGYYTTGGDDMTRVSQAICEVGHFCVGGIKSRCPPGVYGATEGLSTPNCTAVCPIGHYCPEGSTNGTTRRCPAGRYGATTGMYDSSCTDICDAGYHCGEASTSPRQLQCAVYAQKTLPQTIFPVAVDGSYNTYLRDLNMTTVTSGGVVTTTLTNPNNVYCPTGTALPLLALPGYYTINNNATTRTAQLPCPMGTYCMHGIMYDCPAGRYGRAERLQSSECTGLCAKGHYCPPSSTSSTMYPCPAGRYGATEGLTSAECSGACGLSSDCGIGSTISIPLVRAT